MDSSDLYRHITDFARSAPPWVQAGFEVFTEYGLLLFAVLYVAVWWRARGRAPRALALAVLAPLVTALVYVVSELVKSTVEEERPCRAVAGAAAALLPCPPYGDWSFPSNHSAIAGAAAVGVALALPRLAWLTLPVAVLMAYSRVFVGAHYPHDVAMGLLLGACLGTLAVLLLAAPMTRLTTAVRGSGNPPAAWFTGPGPTR
ncbi:phosphatase PAP2 family protein [Streptomyces sp. RerS4]|uniref:phosphatase PAP2 family protein n=1 Tax=Streptomyces sp. RerS4 TaxID=2942449 RepID=UPI00201C56AF|nr:phosphatase PAP2 family protein [Streptomyces sp. RerS4]UQX01665.1 phosphatase PAP2 family protein [Streptomyces sp. RerS4]